MQQPWYWYQKMHTNVLYATEALPHTSDCCDMPHLVSSTRSSNYSMTCTEHYQKRRHSVTPLQ
eukprot:1900-Heterococcus_DN1.PRE.1